MRRLTLLVALLLLCGMANAKPAGLFYLTDSPEGIRSFLAHASKIDILVPTWYQVDENGLVTGGPNMTVLAAAKAKGVPIMPILALFNKKQFHTLAGNPEAWARMNNALLREAKLYGYTGFQFDLENVDYLDRNGLNTLTGYTAGQLHAAGLQLSIATVPNAPGYPGQGGFSKWIFTDWRGAYDLETLAKSVDLICLMTYDQNTHWTMPGPVGGWIWTKQNLDYALKVVPKEKLSLGIAVYGYHWFTGDPGLNKAEKTPNPTAEYISEPNAIYLRDTYGGKTQWDEEEHTPWFYFNRDQMREWVFYTDTRAFMDRYDLAKQSGIQGVCSWVLGEEDPTIWAAIPSKR